MNSKGPGSFSPAVCGPRVRRLLLSVRPEPLCYSARVIFLSVVRIIQKFTAVFSLHLSALGIHQLHHGLFHLGTTTEKRLNLQIGFEANGMFRAQWPILGISRQVFIIVCIRYCIFHKVTWPI